MDWEDEWKPLVVILAVFLSFFYLPIGTGRFDNAIMEALHLTKWYAEEHVILCLVPAFFIAGAIAVFVSQASVIKYLGPKANKILAYSVGSVSGTILAVCSCTVLPLFAGIYQRGAGLGPAIAFLYSGPAINVLAIILTARVLGLELGIARAVGAVAFSFIIGLLMHFIFRKEEIEKANSNLAMPNKEVTRPLWQTSIYFLAMIAILVFANWGKPEEAKGFWYAIYSYKWSITGLASAFFAVLLVIWFGLKWLKILLAAVPTIILAILFPHRPLIPFSVAVIGFSIIISLNKGETEEWFKSSWDFAKQIMPLLFFGVLIAGALLGRPGNEGLIPSEWISGSVGGNSIWSNLFASVAGAFMYFATLTEVPILEGLIGNGMGKGPALALLLAGPALSLPNMLVIRSVIGTKKTVTFITLVVIMATITGMLYGAFFE
ncbi:MAG TPA: permease [Nitrospinota bacterium]|nr:permease [Nitrospinota bacterium]